MADLEADVLPGIVNLVDQVLYPAGDPGSLQPSPTTGSVTKIYPGWPDKATLDADLLNNIVHVSVFSQGGGGGGAVQVLEPSQIIAGPVHTIVPTISGSHGILSNSLGSTFADNILTLYGTVSAGEIVTVTIDFVATFTYTVISSDTLNSVAANLAGLIAMNSLYSLSRANGASIMIPRASYVAVTLTTGNVVTLTGSVTVGQYVTVILDNKATFSYAAVTTDTLTTMATALANLIKAQAPYGSTSSSGPSLTISGASYITVRVGAPGTMGLLEQRTKVPVRVIIWAPTQAAREVTAKAIDPFLQENFRLNFADTSQGLLFYSMTSVDDVPEKANLFRRDLVYTCEYGMVFTFSAFEITSINITLDPGVNRLTPVEQ